MTKTESLLREDAPIESTWNREAVYLTWEAWVADFESAQSDLPGLGKFSGRLKEGPGVLLEWFQVRGVHWRRMMKLYLFARMAVAVDTGDEDAKSHIGQAIGLEAKFKAATAFAEPELLDIGKKIIDWVDEEPGLEIYRHHLENLLRIETHQRSADVEEILGMLREPFGGTERTAQELTNTDLVFSDAIDSHGEAHPVQQATVTPTGIQSSDRQHRRSAWENFCDSHLAMQNTLASNYITAVKQYVFLSRVRGFDSVLEMMLSPTNLPVEVYHTLIDTFKRPLPVWHRYWEVKRSVLKVDELHPYDIWAPIVTKPPVIPYQQAVDWICEALSPIGQQYVDVMRRGCLEERWIDYAPNKDKMQGAASSLRIEMPPFIFMSYNETLMSMSVLAHELGHSMHAYFADENQPWEYTEFDAISSTVAETASNFNQAMLRFYLRKGMGDDRQFQIAMIDEAIYNFHRYFFIMPTLARFEYEVFSRAQQDQPLNASILNQIMADLFTEGYGDTMVDDPERTAITWAQFPHLYFPFYTFQYAVGISAAHALAEKVLTGDQQAAEDYLKFLKAGGSLYSIDLFNLAGVDMTTPEPIEKAFDVLADMIAQLEILAT